jgi:hypothetical protein
MIAMITRVITRLGRSSGAASGKKTLDTQIFVNLGPVNPLAVTKQFPLSARLGARGKESGEPDERNREGATVREPYRQLVFGDGYGSRKGTDSSHC